MIDSISTVTTSENSLGEEVNSPYMAWGRPMLMWRRRKNRQRDDCRDAVQDSSLCLFPQVALLNVEGVSGGDGRQLAVL